MGPSSLRIPGGSVMPQTNRVEAANDTRLASIIRTAANLKDQLRELSKLRDQVREAQLSARRPSDCDAACSKKISARVGACRGETFIQNAKRLVPAKQLERGRYDGGQEHQGIFDVDRRHVSRRRRPDLASSVNRTAGDEWLSLHAPWPEL